MTAPRAVALGGGHGLQATLRALRLLTDDVTAVVTVADDGGSSGRIRRELGLLPPGDLRQALAALADPQRVWATTFQHRFGGEGALAGHAVGNLLLAGLFEVTHDPVAALAEAGRVLGLSGKVLPMCTGPLDIEADVSGLDSDDSGDPDDSAVRRIRGQVAVATTPGRVRRIRLLADAGVPTACEQAVTAVREADLVLLGPGSWFTSVLPHLLVTELAEALVATSAVKVVVVNLVAQPGETAGFTAERHLQVLAEHAPRLGVDAVIADHASAPAPEPLRGAAARLGARLVLGHVASVDETDRHDAEALAAAIATVLREPDPGDDTLGCTAGSQSGEQDRRSLPNRGGEQPWP